MADELVRLEELVTGLETEQKKEKDEALNLIKSIKGFFENRFEKSIPQQLKQAMLTSSNDEDVIEEISETNNEVIITLVETSVNILSSAEKKKKKKKKKSKPAKKVENVDLVTAEQSNNNSVDSINNEVKEVNMGTIQEVKTEIKIEVVAPPTKKE